MAAPKVEFEKGTGGFLHPERIIDQIDLKQGMKIADFGCGSGYFTIPLAQKVGASGRVAAIDIQTAPLEAVRSLARVHNLGNIDLIRGNLEVNRASGLDENSQDMVFLANILFQSQKKSDIIREAKRVLKEGGYLIIIDWKADIALGPKEGYRLSAVQAQSLAEKDGFRFLKKIDAGNFHWGIVLTK